MRARGGAARARSRRELATWLEETTVYSATHRGLAAARLACPDALAPEALRATDRVAAAFDILIVRARAAGALRTGRYRVAARNMNHVR